MYPENVTSYVIQLTNSLESNPGIFLSLSGMYHGDKGLLKLADHVGCSLADFEEQIAQTSYEYIYTRIISIFFKSIGLKTKFTGNIKYGDKSNFKNTWIKTVKTSEENRRKELKNG